MIPSDRMLSMKRLAVAFGGKSAAMMPPEQAVRLTGYHTGGTSPSGPGASADSHESTLTVEEVVINGARRGLMRTLAAADALAEAGELARRLGEGEC
nr:hypothetical protein [Cereibacter sphaeroides]